MCFSSESQSASYSSPGRIWFHITFRFIFFPLSCKSYWIFTYQLVVRGNQQNLPKLLFRFLVFRFLKLNMLFGWKSETRAKLNQSWKSNSIYKRSYLTTCASCRRNYQTRSDLNVTSFYENFFSKSYKGNFYIKKRLLYRVTSRSLFWIIYFDFVTFCEVLHAIDVNLIDSNEIQSIIQ